MRYAWLVGVVLLAGTGVALAGGVDEGKVVTRAVWGESIQQVVARGEYLAWSESRHAAVNPGPHASSGHQFRVYRLKLDGKSEPEVVLDTPPSETFPSLDLAEDGTVIWNPGPSVLYPLPKAGQKLKPLIFQKQGVWVRGLGPAGVIGEAKPAGGGDVQQVFVPWADGRLDEEHLQILGSVKRAYGGSGLWMGTHHALVSVAASSLRAPRERPGSATFRLWDLSTRTAKECWTVGVGSLDLPLGLTDTYVYVRSRAGVLRITTATGKREGVTLPAELVAAPSAIAWSGARGVLLLRNPAAGKAVTPPDVSPRFAYVDLEKLTWAEIPMRPLARFRAADAQSGAVYYSPEGIIGEHHTIYVRMPDKAKPWDTGEWKSAEPATTRAGNAG